MICFSYFGQNQNKLNGWIGQDWKSFDVVGRNKSGK